MTTLPMPYYEALWLERYERLLQYVQRFGTARVPQKYREEDRFRLGVWVAEQRRAHAFGTMDSLRRWALELLPGWTWNVHVALWDRHFDSYLRYAEGAGTSDVPPGYEDEEGFRLDRWVAEQRRRRQQGRLRADRSSRLQAVEGWTWSVRERAWEAALTRYVSYVETAGTARIAWDWFDKDGFWLGAWANRQRWLYRTGGLEQEKVRRLEGLAGWSAWLAPPVRQGIYWPVKERLGVVRRH